MVGRLYSVVLDCPDPRSLAGFYAELLGARTVVDRDDWVSIVDDSGARLGFQRAPRYQPPTFPDPHSSQQLHLDVVVDDVDAAERRAIELGATRLPQEGEDFRVFTDPAGHTFCLVWEVTQPTAPG
jgi:catechol 2,3-dioxygenase-like lactoylglutathione lyase family enzyme